MATNNLSIILDLKDNASKELQGFAGKVKGMESTFKKMAGFGTVAFTAIAGSVAFAVKEFSKFEQAEVAFTSMLGSAELAKEMIKDLAEFSAKTPFQFEDIVSATRTLLAFGIEADDAKDKLKFLGDISAGAQIPLADLSQIFGKITTKGKAMTEEIMQLSERGIPVIDALAEQFGVTKEAIFEMAEQGELSAEVVETALLKMTTEGGIFQDQMVKQSQTVAGQFSTMKDNMTLSMVAVGAMFADESVVIIEAISKISNAFRGFAESGNPMIEIAIKLGLLFTALIAVIGFVGLAVIVVTKYFALLAAVFKITSATLVVMMLKFLLIVGVVAIIVAAAWYLYKNWDLAVGAMAIVFASVGNVIKSIFEGVINFIISGINLAIDALNVLIRQLEKVPGAGKIGISQISRVENVGFDQTDTGAMYNDLMSGNKTQGASTVVNITGNSFMGEEDMAEKIGNKLMSIVKLNAQV